MTETSTPQATREQLIEDFSTVVADAEKLLRDLGAAGSEKAQGLRGDLEGKLKEARESLDRLHEATRDQTREAARRADEYVRTNPWQSLGIAAAVAAIVGLLIGLLLSRE